MERLSATTGAGCLAVIEGGQDDLVVAASTHESRRGVAPTRVGQRLPFAPPLGGLFVAWAPAQQKELWLTRATDERQRERLRLVLDRIRSRGFSLSLDGSAHAELELALTRLESEPGLEPRVQRLLRQVTGDYEPEDLDRVQSVRQLAAPVFGPTGEVVMYLMLFGLASLVDPGTLHRTTTDLLDAAGRVSASLAALPQADD
jgi:DNA-binding IclR family transcriptional regulator